MSAWRWVKAADGTRLRDVAVNADGTLHNPNGYPEDAVRAAVANAEARRHERRSQSAKKAAVTKAERREKRIYAVVQTLIAGGSIVPSDHCDICHKALTDDVSIARGIGSDCWQDVLSYLTAAQERRDTAA